MINFLQKDGSALDSFLHTIDKRSLRERIEQIEYIANGSRKSHLLNQRSTRSKVSVKHTENERNKKQKDIDDLYRSIEHKVFGREKERKHTCGMLREGPNAHAASSSTSKCYFVVGIYGIAGSGNSTLAQYICEYEEVILTLSCSSMCLRLSDWMVYFVKCWRRSPKVGPPVPKVLKVYTKS